MLARETAILDRNAHLETLATVTGWTLKWEKRVMNCLSVKRIKKKNELFIFTSAPTLKSEYSTNLEHLEFYNRAL